MTDDEIKQQVGGGISADFILKHHDLEGFESDPAIESVARAADGAHDSLVNALKAKHAYASDPTLTEPAQLIKSADYASKRFEEANRRFDKAQDVLSEQLKNTEAELNSLVATNREPNETLAHSEIRSYVRNLPEDKRRDFVHQAIESGDESVARAILGAPPYLSGLQATDQYRMEFFKKLAPEQYKRMNALKRANELHNLVGNAFMERAYGSREKKGFIDFKAANEYRERAKKAREQQQQVA